MPVPPSVSYRYKPFCWQKRTEFFIQSTHDNSWGEHDEVCARSDEPKTAGAMDGEVKAEKNVADFCISFAESALRLASTGGKKEIKTMTRVTFDSTLDMGELCRCVKRVEVCKHTLVATTKMRWKSKVS